MTSKMASTLRPLALVLILQVIYANCFTPPDNTTVPGKFVINLDLPEEQRWTHIMENYKQIVPDVYNVMSSYLSKLPLPVNFTIEVVESVAADLDQYFPPPYAGEMRGVAKSLNMSLGAVVGVNILYDVTAFCTSIVMQDTNGQIWHSRNLDFSFTKMLRDITVQVDFVKNNQTVYSGVTYAGYVGLVTGIRPKAFTITMDERDQGAWWENFMIGLIDRKAMPMSFLLRDTLAMAESFDAAVQKLSYTTTEASAYFILGGVNKGEGMVITKGRLAAIDSWRIDADHGRWFEVETNYDHWEAPPSSDDRRDPAIKMMTALGPKNITVNSLFQVMSTAPVLNNHTTYTIIMSAAQPQLTQVWIRHYDVL